MSVLCRLRLGFGFARGRLGLFYFDRDNEVHERIQSRADLVDDTLERFDLLLGHLRTFSDCDVIAVPIAWRMLGLPNNGEIMRTRSSKRASILVRRSAMDAVWATSPSLTGSGMP